MFDSDISDGNGNITEEEIAEFIFTIIKDEPWVFFLSFLVVLGVMTVFLTFMVIGIARAGKFSPPVVVVTVVLGLVAMMSLLVYAFRPDNEALGNVVSAAVGGLAGALGTAFAAKKFNEKELAFIERKIRNEQLSKSESDGGDDWLGDSVGDLDNRYGDMARHVHGDSDSSIDGGDSDDSSIRSGVLSTGPETDELDSGYGQKNG